MDINWQDSGYVTTYTGRRFYPEYPEKLYVCISDIAHALSNVCRYNGHLSSFYSVAQHSVIVCQLLSKEITDSKTNLLQALLHDATEAYLPDMPSPIKKLLPDFRALERRLQQRIMHYFWLPEDIDPLIKEIDVKLRASEVRSMQTWEDCPAEDFYGLNIEPLSPRDAKRLFLDTYFQVRNADSSSHIVLAW